MFYNRDVLVGLLFGFIVGGLFTVIFAVNFPGTITYRAISAKNECELDLPRTQRCIITAIPKEK